MNAFNILKPDLIKDHEALKLYFSTLSNNFKIKSYNIINLDNWIKFAACFYDNDILSNSPNQETIYNKRKQLFITLMVYKHYYENDNAYACFYELDNDNEELLEQLLEQLHEFKKHFRKKTVHYTNKNFIYINNISEINFNLSLPELLNAEYDYNIVSIPFSDDISDKDYNMGFLNKLHFPDPNEVDLKREKIFLLEYIRNNQFDRKLVLERKK